MTKLVAVTGVTGFVGPHLVAALARRGFKLRLLVRRWSPLPSLEGVAADMVLGDLSDEAALKRLVAGRRCRRPCRRPHQGAPAVRVHDREPRRHGAAVGAGARSTIPSSVVAGGARAAALALCREQARGGGGGGRPLGALAHGACTGGLRPRRPRDPGLLQGRRPRPRPAAQGGRCPAVADPCRRPRRGAGACPRPAAAAVDLRNR